MWVTNKPMSPRPRDSGDPMEPSDCSEFDFLIKEGAGLFLTGLTAKGNSSKAPPPPPSFVLSVLLAYSLYNNQR